MAIDTIIDSQKTLINEFFNTVYEAHHWKTIKESCANTGVSPHTFSNFLRNQVAPMMDNFSVFIEIVNCQLTLAIESDDPTSPEEEVFDTEHIFGGILRKAYMRYLSKCSQMVSIPGQNLNLRNNDKLALSVDTGISNMELRRLFELDDPPTPKLDTFLRLCYILKVQITLDPPELMAPTLDKLVLNPVTSAIPAVGRVAQRDEEKDTE